MTTTQPIKPIWMEKPIWTQKHIKIAKEFEKHSKSDQKPIIYNSYSDYMKALHAKIY